MSTTRTAHAPATGTRYTYRRPPLYPMQAAALFCPERYAVVEASTKSGKTVGCMAWLLEQAVDGKAGQQFWWIAPILAQARIPYRRMKRGLPPETYAANDGELTLALPNGATLWFKGADNPDSLYGEDVYAAVMDEATRCKEEAWFALRSTLTATRGPVRLIGNVKGRRNWAYRLARRAEAGEPDWHYAKITAHDAAAAGVLDAAEVEDARRTLPESVFGELYLAEPSDDEGNPFGIESIRACVVPALSSGKPTAFGVDLAKSVDYTAVVGLDAAGAVCRLERFQAPWEETTERVLRSLGATPARCDSTGVGDPIVERLARRGAAVTGYHFTAQSKQQAMEGLAVAIQQREISFPDGVLRAELDAFEYVYTRGGVKYSAPEGVHDDTVCALALAVVQRGQRVRRWGIAA